MVSGTSLFLGLLNNLVVLILLVAVYGALLKKIENFAWWQRQALLGAIFGGFAIACMHVKIPVAGGVIVDQRNVIVTLSGAFGGPVSALVSAIFASLYRAYLGGIGVLGGTFGICVAALSGTLIYLNPQTQRNLFTIALVSLATALLIMPGFILIGDFQAGWNLMVAMTPPFGTAVFIGIFMGSILLNRENKRRRIERERAIAERERQEAHQELIRANRAKSDFLATMSHELRTPLNAILGFSDLLLMPLPRALSQEQQKEYLTSIRSSGQHLLSLINDILDIATIEAGKRQITKHPFDLNKVLDAVVGNFEKDTREKALTITIENPPAPLIVNADQRAMAQIALNLLSNAVKFTEHQGQITIRAESRSDDVVLSIEDNGIGIAANRIPTITDPFNSATTPAYTTAQGSGLGLSIVKSLAELHGGELSIESREGHGTTMSVRLPKD